MNSGVVSKVFLQLLIIFEFDGKLCQKPLTNIHSRFYPITVVDEIQFFDERV